MSTFTEILEQRDTIGKVLASQKAAVLEVAREIKKRDPAYLFLAARGTSDNAGRYAN